jgi:hypothetical protein
MSGPYSTATLNKVQCGEHRMSRREIPLDLPKMELWIGRDPGLETFFFQGYDWEKPEADNRVIWLGALPPHFKTIDALLAHLKDEIGLELDLPADLREELEMDQQLNC